MVSIVSMNVRGIGSSVRRAAVFKKLIDLNGDVVFVQECMLSNAPKPSEWEYGQSVWSVACTSKKKLRCGCAGEVQ